ncbi:50S ribosomal protein L11 methyltransferase [Sinisalibacter lacisalsi]|uniref:Ribosomal protein L11 methyltransferase n=1 Tax=Sinisalibacter lacisalsi TaxID=1526570 RepID=A0ABQ1QNE3_9RHOB|nr:50S ribosomal protein L11 methyltransferase [Sinisalibacter lacisalsi]GGD35514.1 ribosomal protein L11 methyltransferase [Sinisalibacter lacisalsi]
MPTFTAFTTLDGHAPAEALGAALEDLDPAPTGVGVFEVEDGSGLWEVGGYFTEAPDEIALALLAKVHGAGDFTVSELPETDWVAHVKRALSPVEAGRFFVYGSHDADRVPAGKVALRIEAAMAFGTGHHGTTLGCLSALDALVTQGLVKRNIADIGCGTAVLAMAAAKVWPRPVIASDIDAVAVDVARANIEANGLSERVHAIEAAGFDHPDLAAAAPFDLVFANILKGPLLALAPEMAVHVAPGGHAILSGILNHQADEVVAAYKAQGFVLASRAEYGDWTTLVLTRNP